MKNILTAFPIKQQQLYYLDSNRYLTSSGDLASSFFKPDLANIIQ